MTKAEKNLNVIQNFILHITHSNEGDADSNKSVKYTANELYQMAEVYIEEDHVDGKENPENNIDEDSESYGFINEFGDWILCQEYKTDVYQGIEIFKSGNRIGTMILQLPDKGDDESRSEFESKVHLWMLENE